MYRAIVLAIPDKDLHRFVWRRTPNEPLTDYRMKRLTFGASVSLFIANMAIKQNAEDFASQYPLASRAVNDSFYVDDELTGANTREEAIELQHQYYRIFFNEEISYCASGTQMIHLFSNICQLN